jgi:rhodanese-related sulfurtransferase
MSQIIAFMMQHWVLVGAFVAVLIAVFVFEMMEQTRQSFQISAQKVVDLVNHEDATIVDLRDKDIFRQGHVIRALSISQTELDRDDARLKGYKQKCLILMDASGREAALLATQLMKKGYAKVYVLKGGLSTWRQAGLPLEK